MKEAERRQARIFSFRTFGCGSRWSAARSPTGVPLRRLRQRTNAAAQLQAHFLGRG